MAGALLIASCLGGPVMFGVGLKLGMFAAIGGGIMGYTTGKMIEEHGLVSLGLFWCLSDFFHLIP